MHESKIEQATWGVTSSSWFCSVCFLEDEELPAWVVVSNIFYFHPYLGKWSHLTNIFQIGWNHHLPAVLECHKSFEFIAHL